MATEERVETENPLPLRVGAEALGDFVDGLPMNENRSPGFAPPIESSDVESMRVMTAGFPAEYGRKLGGVVEVHGSHR